MMDWFKNHGDTIAIFGTFALCFWNMNEKINTRLNSIGKDIVVIKTVLLMKNILPADLATSVNNKE